MCKKPHNTDGSGVQKEHWFHKPLLFCLFFIKKIKGFVH